MGWVNACPMFSLLPFLVYWLALQREPRYIACTLIKVHFSKEGYPINTFFEIFRYPDRIRAEDDFAITQSAAFESQIEEVLPQVGSLMRTKRVGS